MNPLNSPSNTFNFLSATFNPPISISVLTSEGKKGFFGSAAGGVVGTVAGGLINPTGAIIGGAAGLLAGGNRTQVTYTITYTNGWVTTRTVPHKEFVKIYKRVASQIVAYERGQAKKLAKGQAQAQQEAATMQSEMLKAQRETTEAFSQMSRKAIESNAPQQQNNSTDIASQILSLSELYKQGVLSASEFEAAKAKVIGNGTASSNRTISTEDVNTSLTAFAQQPFSTGVEVKANYPQVETKVNTSSLNLALQRFQYLCGWAVGGFLGFIGMGFILKAKLTGVFFIMASCLCLPPVVKFMTDNLGDFKISPLQRIGAVVALSFFAIFFYR